MAPTSQGMEPPAIPGRFKAEVWTKLEDALALLAAYSPRTIERIGRFVHRVMVISTPWKVDGMWRADERMIQLSLETVLLPKRPAALVACTIVHECTHAWLEHLGFKYSESCRQRLEAACFRAEAAAARRMPNGQALAEYCEACAVQTLADGGAWTEDGFAARDQEARERIEDQMVEARIPSFLRGPLKWLIRSRSA